MTWNILEGDCVDLMAGLEPGSVDAVVCDPPYGIGFMGKAWDAADIHERARRDIERNPSAARLATGRTSSGWSADGQAGLYDQSLSGHRAFQVWSESWAREAFRVLKPGGHMLVCGGTRTYHRMAAGVEDAGFEIRDCLAWLYGSGFPKSLDVSKAIDNRNGAKRERQEPQRRVNPSNAIHQSGFGVDGWAPTVREAVTEDAQRWEGWGTALKPAHEPIVLARKPLVGTVAGNVLEHGVGALNVDGCRIPMSDDDREAARVPEPALGSETGLVYGFQTGEGRTGRTFEPATAGRWPANVVLDEQAAAMLDEQSGWSKSPPVGSTARLQRPASPHTVSLPPIELPNGYGDSGGASRFFYVAKASRAERNAGLEDFEERVVQSYDGGDMLRPGAVYSDGVKRSGVRQPKRNVHPTVKPVGLMRWLVRLVTPPGGVVLDPFAGSGTTGVAAVLEGFNFVGVEREPEYVELARARIGWWLEHGEEALRIVREREARDAERAATLESGQLELGVG